MNVCPSCGTPNPVSAKFCQECGTRLTPSEAIDTAPPSNEPDQPSTSATVNVEELPNDQSDSPEGPAVDSSTASEVPGESARPKKEVSGLPPSWMPAPVTLSARPSGQRPIPATPPQSPPPPVTTSPPPVAPTPSINEPAVDGVPSNEIISPSKDVTGLPPSWMPPPVDLGAPRPIVKSAPDPDWKMSDAGPLPERRDRRLWLWIPVGLIAIVLVCCIAFFIWATTIGSDTVDGWATNAANNQTEESTGGN